MKILLYEHISGGGYAGQAINPGVLAEGYGMMRTLAADFKGAGHEVTVCLDSRLFMLNPPIVADKIVPIFTQNGLEKKLLTLGEEADANCIIAPETAQTLKSLVQLVTDAGYRSINCEPNAIEQVSNKSILYEILKRKGLGVPETLSFDGQSSPNVVRRAIRRKLGYPLVFKPIDGVSCAGLSVVTEDRQVETAVERVKAASAGNQFIVQEFVKGDAASVSLFCTNKKALAISLNKQKVNLTSYQSSASYDGGEIPFEHPAKTKAFKTAEAVAESFVGLRGYVGVDIVLTGKDVYVVDVNPRLTTSYVGLSKVAGFSIAGAMLKVALEQKLPVASETKGFVYFSKVRSCYPTLEDFRKVVKIKEVISPPFPLTDNSASQSLVFGYAFSCEAAKLQFEEAKKRLYTIMGGQE